MFCPKATPYINQEKRLSDQFFTCTRKTTSSVAIVSHARSTNKLEYRALKMGFPLISSSRIALQRNDELHAN
jgi:hypothetical protein